MLIKFISMLLLFVFHSMVPSTATAQESDNLSLADLLNMKVEMGSFLEEATLQDLPAQVTIITKQEIRETGARDLGEALSILVPGYLKITDEDDYIHGFRGLVQDMNNTVVLLVNGQNIGITINRGMAAQAQILDLHHVEKIEVITGPGSVKVGTGPLTGIINVITHQPEDKKSGLDASVAYGTGDLKVLNGTIHYNENDLLFQSSFSYFQQKDGFKPKSGDATWTMPDFDNNRYFEVMPGHALFLSGQYEGIKMSAHSTFSSFDAYTVERISFYQTLGFTVEKNFMMGNKFSVLPEIHFNMAGNNARNEIEIPGEGEHAGETVFGGKLVFNFSPKDYFNVAFGGDCDYYRYGPNPFNDYGAQRGWPDWGTNYNYDGSKSHTNETWIKMYADQKAINPGGFLETIIRINQYNSLLASIRVMRIDVHDFNDISPRFVYSGKAGEFGWKLFFTHASSPIFAGSNPSMPPGGLYKHYVNPDLVPQTIDDFEVNFTYNSNYFGLDLRGFYAINDNIIQGGGVNVLLESPSDFVADNFWWTYANAGQLQTAGGEFIVTSTPMDNLNLRLSHAIVKVVKNDLSIDHDLFVSGKLNRFLNYPENVTRLNIRYNPLQNLIFHSSCLIDYGRVQGNPNFEAKYGVSSSSIAAGEVSDNWYNLNLGAIWTLYNNLDISAHVFNVFNSRPYQPVVFQNSKAVTPTGTSYKVELTYHIN